MHRERGWETESEREGEKGKQGGLGRVKVGEGG